MAVEALGRITDYWDEALAVGLGIVVVDMLSDRVASFLSKWVPEKWLDVATEGGIGLGEPYSLLNGLPYRRIGAFSRKP